MPVQIGGDPVIQLHILLLFIALLQIGQYGLNKFLQKGFYLLYGILFRNCRISLSPITQKTGYLHLFFHKRLDNRPNQLLVNKHHIIIGNILYGHYLLPDVLQLLINGIHFLQSQVIDDFILTVIGIIVSLALIYPVIPEDDLILTRYNPVLHRRRGLRQAFIQIINIRMHRADADSHRIIQNLFQFLLKNSHASGYKGRHFTLIIGFDVQDHRTGGGTEAHGPGRISLLVQFLTEKILYLQEIIHTLVRIIFAQQIASPVHACQKHHEMLIREQLLQVFLFLAGFQRPGKHFTQVKPLGVRVPFFQNIVDLAFFELHLFKYIVQIIYFISRRFFIRHFTGHFLRHVFLYTVEKHTEGLKYPVGYKQHQNRFHCHGQDNHQYGAVGNFLGLPHYLLLIVGCHIGPVVEA